MRAHVAGALIGLAALGLLACSDSSTDPAPTSTSPPASEATTTTTSPPTTTVPETTTTSTMGTVPDGAVGFEGEIADALAGAAEQSWEAEGTFEVTGDVDGSGTIKTVEIAYRGAYDATSGDSYSAIDFSELQGGVDAELPPGMAEAFTTFEARVVDGVSYLRFALFSLMFGAETEWVSVPEEDSDATSGVVPFADFANVANVVVGLDGGLADATEIGLEMVRGVVTTRYRIMVEVASIAGPTDGPVPEGLQPIEVWIDADGNLRRYAIDVQTLGDGQSALIVIDFTSLGIPVTVEAPDPADVTDLSQLMPELPTP